jgi:hypothetical protein
MDSRKPPLFAIPPGIPSSICRAEECGATIFWIRTIGGKRMPVNPDGTSHFATCKKADEFRRNKATGRAPRPLE